jgi:hypothetical protein
MNLPAPTQSNTNEYSSSRNAPPKMGLRLRALVVAIPLLIGICFLSVYADMVAQTVQFGVLQFAPPAIVALFLVALINRGLRQLTKREWLSHADVLIIYAMTLTGTLVSTRGVIEKLIPPLAYLPYFANQENKLNEQITQHLPSWALPFVPTSAASPPSDVIRGYYEGVSKGQSIPWGAWIPPLLVWFGLICCVLMVFACLSTLLRRQWMDNEQLRFPLTTLPLAMIRDEVEGQPFFTNKMMWGGFAFATIIFGVNGMNANFAEWPRFVIDFDFAPFFSEKPWDSVYATYAFVSLAAIGFFFFLPTDLLFSLWFFFILTRLQDAAAVQLGGVPTPMVSHSTRVWTGYQAAGAYVVLIIAQTRIAWPHYKQVWRTAFPQLSSDRIQRLDDSDELMSYRSALIGLFTAFAGIVLWLTVAGMNPIVAMLQMGIYLFFIAVIMSRGVAEAGLLMTETSFRPIDLMKLVYPVQNMGAVNLSMMGLLEVVFIRDLRGVMLSPFLDNQKMAGELKVRQRTLLMPLILAIVIAFVVASYFFLKFNYELGGLSLFKYSNQNNARNIFNLTSAAITGDLPKPDSTAYGGFAVGIVATALMTWARSLYTWFPLNPLAYAIAPTYAMSVLWFSCFIAWILKGLTMRFGGIDLFRKFAPFMLGLILGEFTSAVFWAILTMYKPTIWGFPFTSAPGFPWQ